MFSKKSNVFYSQNQTISSLKNIGNFIDEALGVFTFQKPLLTKELSPASFINCSLIHWNATFHKVAGLQMPVDNDLTFFEYCRSLHIYPTEIIDCIIKQEDCYINLAIKNNWYKFLIIPEFESENLRAFIVIIKAIEAEVEDKTDSLNSQVIDKYEELSDRENIYKSIIEQSTIGIQILSAQGKHLLANKVYSKIFNTYGSSANQFNFLCSKEAKKYGFAEYAKKIKNGESVYLQPIPFNFWDDFGLERKVWLQIKGFPILNFQGKVENIILMFENITEKIIAEQEARQSEDKYLNLIENANDVIFSFDSSGIISFISANVKQFTGYEPEIYIGKNILDFVCPEDKLKVIRNLKLSLDTKEEKITVFRLQNAWNRELIVEVTGKIVIDKFSGEVTSINGIAREITEKIHIENALKESEERYKSLFENATIGLYRTTPDGKVLIANQALIQMLGYCSLEELQNINLNSDNIFLNKTERLQYRQQIELKGSINGYESIWRKKDGTIIYVRESAKAYKNKGETLYYEGTVEEITQKKIAEERLRASEEKFRMLAHRMSDVVWLMHADLRYNYVSPSIQQFLGYDPLEFMNLLPEKQYEIKSLQLLKQQFSDSISAAIKNKGEAVSFSLNVQMYHKMQHLIWGEMQATIVYNIQTNAIAIQGITRNIQDRKIAEEQLRESETRYKTIFENSGTSMIIVDDTHVIRMANNIFYALTGYAAVEVINIMKWTHIVHPDDLPLMLDYSAKRLEGIAVPSQYEIRIIHKSQKILNLIINAAKIPNTRLILASHLDITEWKNAQQQLLESEFKFRNFLDNMVDCCYVLDHNLKYLFVNKAACCYVGKKAELLVGKRITDVFPGFAYTEFCKVYQEALKTKANSEITDFIINDFGKLEWYHDRISVVAEGIIVVSSNITDIKNAEKALKESEKKYRNIFENLSDVFYRTNMNGDITMVSPSICEAFDYESINDVLGINVVYDFYLYQEDRVKLFEILYKYGKAKNFPLWLKHKTKGEVYCETNCYLVYDDIGNPVGIEGLLHDMTEQKKSEELRQNMQLIQKSAEIKQQFLANMSHEIRTPMTGILGLIDFLIQSGLKPVQLDYANTIKSSANSLLNIINEVLILSKIEAGKLDLISIPFNLKQTLHEVIALFQAAAQQKKIQIHFVEEDTPIYFSGDVNRLKQVLNNLLSNAIKFTDQFGLITVKYFLINETEQQCEFKFEITDTGIGISKGNQEMLFNKFSQVDASLTKNYDGIGLGLNICKEIVQLMNGIIGVESQLGIGSTFWFTVKLTKNHAPEAENLARNSETIPNQAFPCCHVLLVEDKMVNYKVASMMLENLGCTVELAVNGQEAIEKFEEEKFDIIFMDIQMPVMDGIQATKEILARYKNVPPIICLSANAMEGDAEKYLAHGMSDYIPKPVNQEILERKILQWYKS